MRLFFILAFGLAVEANTAIKKILHPPPTELVKEQIDQLNGFAPRVARSLSPSDRLKVTTNSEFINCQFHALSALAPGDSGEYGGAMYAKGVSVNCSGCLFSGNVAVHGGCGCFITTQLTFDNCNFTFNRATNDAGVFICSSSDMSLTECNFIRNIGETYTAVMKATDSCKIRGEAIILHENEGAYQTSGIDLVSSSLVILGGQFSANICRNQDGGVVFSLKSSTLGLTGCNFESTVRVKVEKKPIRADESSHVTARQCCFDTTRDLLKSGLSGAGYSDSMGTIYDDACKCKAVVVPQAFEILSKTVVVENSMTMRFVVVAVGLIGVAFFVIVALTAWEADAKAQWSQLW
jgi:hypothetical protein